MVLMLTVHPSRRQDLLTPFSFTSDPAVPFVPYRDSYGNDCTRIVAPPGSIRITADALIADSGQPDPQVPEAPQHPVEALPDETLLFLLGSRYCDTDLLTDTAWSLFGNTPLGWPRVQAICAFVNGHIKFGYQYARSTRTASEGFRERIGVCRDFAHLAVAFCRCMNIPARYCTGYLGDIGVPAVPEPMDFSGWFEAYLGGRWYAFDARHNAARIGRIPIAVGRDAADVAISTTFGPNVLTGFRVWTDEVRA